MMSLFDVIKYSNIDITNRAEVGRLPKEVIDEVWKRMYPDPQGMHRPSYETKITHISNITADLRYNELKLKLLEVLNEYDEPI